MHTLLSLSRNVPNGSHCEEKFRCSLKESHIFHSFSHKNNFVVGVGSSVPCGIDIEILCSKHASFKNFVLTNQEQKIVSDPVIGWAIKESCFKVFNDGYEAQDFVIKKQLHDSYIIQSDNYSYKVKTNIFSGYVIAYAFVLE